MSLFEGGSRAEEPQQIEDTFFKKLVVARAEGVELAHDDETDIVVCLV